MTPEQKALELIKKFSNYAYWNDGSDNNLESSKICALICVDEISKLFYTELQRIYWEDVKQEIKKL